MKNETPSQSPRSPPFFPPPPFQLTTWHVPSCSASRRRRATAREGPGAGSGRVPAAGPGDEAACGGGRQRREGVVGWGLVRGAPAGGQCGRRAGGIAKVTTDLVDVVGRIPTAGIGRDGAREKRERCKWPRAERTNEKTDPLDPLAWETHTRPPPRAPAFSLPHSNKLHTHTHTTHAALPLPSPVSIVLVPLVAARPAFVKDGRPLVRRAQLHRVELQADVAAFHARLVHGGPDAGGGDGGRVLRGVDQGLQLVAAAVVLVRGRAER